MIRNFFEPEEFSENNGYFCNSCNKVSSIATKETIIQKMPPYLIIHLNRLEKKILIL